MSSFEMMNERVETNYSETASDIGNPDLDAFNVTTTTCASCPTTTTTTTTAAPTTTTAAPTTTTAAPTTTTAAPTTTTAAPTTTSTTTTTTTTTTTAKPGTGASVQETNASGYVKKDKAYSVEGTIVLETSDGKDIKKADVAYTIKLRSGQTKTFTGTTNNKGKMTIDWSGFPSNAIYPATITITSVTLDGETFTPKPAVFVWAET